MSKNRVSYLILMSTNIQILTSYWDGCSGESFIRLLNTLIDN